ncbi:MAG TPA: hypothetical protein VIB08_01895 [Thermoanaerobaculia bacterium]
MDTSVAPETSVDAPLSGGTDNLLEFDPNWCIFFGRKATAFHLEIWLPYIRRSRYRFVVMAGEDGFSSAVRARVAEIPNCVILEPFEAAKAWLRLCSGFRGFLYIGNKQENFKLVNNFPGKLHIWLGHGESDKVYNAFRTASLYDSMFVARYGVVHRYPAAIRRWVAGGACAIGTPVVEGALKDPWDGPRPIRTLLYAPTWEGHGARADYSSLGEIGPDLAAAIPALAERGTRVVMRPHPMTGHRRPELREIRDAILAAGAIGGRDKAQDFAEADLILSDISGVTAELLFTEKPAVMVMTERIAGLGKDDARIAEEYPWVYRWKAEAEPLVEQIARLEASDPLRGARASAAAGMFAGNRSMEDAVRTFDLALSSVRFRRTRIPVRYAFAAKRLLARLRRERQPRPGSFRGRPRKRRR